MNEWNVKLDQLVEAAREEYGLPGLVIGVSIGTGSSVLSEGLEYKGVSGYKNNETREKLRPEHIFHMASVTKLFVGTGIMQLWEKGILSLDERLVDVIPELKNGQKQFGDITVKHLLTHTAGLGNVSEFGWNEPKIAPDTLQNYVVSEEIRTLPFLSAINDGEFHYSDIGYELLGAIVERKTGEKIEDYIRSHIFAPLGMDESTLLTFARSYALAEFQSLKEDSGFLEQMNSLGERKLADKLLSLEVLDRLNVAMPHRRTESGGLALEKQYPYNREHAPSSTLTCNLADLEKFIASHLAHTNGDQETLQLLKPETYDLIWKEYALVPNNGEHIGLSWFIREQQGYTFYGHEGTDDGFRSSVWICPELNMSVIVCANVTKAPVKRIGKQIVEVLLNL